MKFFDPRSLKVFWEVGEYADCVTKVEEIVLKPERRFQFVAHGTRKLELLIYPIDRPYIVVGSIEGGFC